MKGLALVPREAEIKMVALDSTDESMSVAEARHLARKSFLLPALEALFEIGMNKEGKDADRNTALRFIIEFASEAQGTDGKIISRLSPAAARLIAKAGLTREVHKDFTEGERVADSDADRKK